jgi:hypothetical protein
MGIEPSQSSQKPVASLASPLHFYASAAIPNIDFDGLWNAIPPRATASVRRLLLPRGTDTATFARDHEAAWGRLQGATLGWQQIVPSKLLHCGPKTFLAGWFCPQAASGLSTLLDQQVTLLCTGVAGWLTEFQQKGLCLEIRNADAPVKLRELLKSAKPLAGMLDRVYADSEAVQVRFGLGSIQMPKRILDALISYEYELHIPELEGNTLKDGDRLATKGSTAGAVAQWYADQLHKRVVQKPSDWLTLYSL